MEREKLRALLVTHLDTLRRNLEVVSMEILKTKYEKPYKALAKDICTAASEYTRELSLSGIRLKTIYFNDAKTYIDSAIKKLQSSKKFPRQHSNARILKKLKSWHLNCVRRYWTLCIHFFLNTCVYICLLIVLIFQVRCQISTTMLPVVFGRMALGFPLMTQAPERFFSCVKNRLKPI